MAKNDPVRANCIQMREEKKIMICKTKIENRSPRISIKEQNCHGWIKADCDAKVMK
jgi:hypothetical protein